jgi:elongation factor G
MSFKMAGTARPSGGAGGRRPVVLEPISPLEVTVPDELQGDVMGDLNSRRARVQGTELADEATRRSSSPRSPPPRCAATRSTCARRPAAAAASPLRHDHYDVMPPNLVARVAGSAAAE